MCLVLWSPLHSFSEKVLKVSAQGFKLSFTVGAPKEAERNLCCLPLAARPWGSSPGIWQALPAPFPETLSSSSTLLLLRRECSLGRRISMCPLPWAKHCKATLLHAPSCIPMGRMHTGRGSRWRNYSERQFSPSTTQREKTVTWRSYLLAESKLIPEMRVGSGAENWYMRAEISW